MSDPEENHIAMISLLWARLRSLLLYCFLMFAGFATADTATHHYNTALDLKARGRIGGTNGAIAAFRRAIDSDPTNWSAYMMLSMTLDDANVRMLGHDRDVASWLRDRAMALKPGGHYADSFYNEATAVQSAWAEKLHYMYMPLLHDRARTRLYDEGVRRLAASTGNDADTILVLDGGAGAVAALAARHFGPRARVLATTSFAHGARSDAMLADALAAHARALATLPPLGAQRKRGRGRKGKRRRASKKAAEAAEAAEEEGGSTPSPRA